MRDVISPSTEEELLEDLRALLAAKGRLSTILIRRSPGIATPSTYCHRFGSLRNAYELIGYTNPCQFKCVDTRNRTTAIREELIAQIAKAFPTQCVSHSPWRALAHSIAPFKRPDCLRACCPVSKSGEEAASLAGLFCPARTQVYYSSCATGCNQFRQSLICMLFLIWTMKADSKFI